MNPTGKKFLSLFIILSLLTVNCTILDFIELTPPPKTKKKDQQKQNIILLSEVHTIMPGTPIVVILKSAEVKGKYLELVRVPAEEYAASYANCREQIKEEIVLPELGDTVTVIATNGKQYELGFLGFDYGTILFRFERMGKTRTAKENIRLIKNIVDSHGNIIGVEAVRRLISEGKISILSSGIIIKSKAGRTQIAWEDIYQIQVKEKGMPSAVILVVGGLIGGVLFAILMGSIITAGILQ